MLREVAPGVLCHGWSRWAINCYLVGDVLIDALTRGDAGRLIDALANRPLRLLALTHVHPDHQGAAHAVCARRQVPLACHAADQPVMEGKAPMEPPPRGLLTPLFRKMWSGPPHRVDQTLKEGDEINGFRVIETPGHTPGHVAFFRESDGVAIVGDAVFGMGLFSTIPGLQEPPAKFTANPALNRQSIRKLAALRPKLLLFGHGPPAKCDAAWQRFLNRLPD